MTLYLNKLRNTGANLFISLVSHTNDCRHAAPQRSVAAEGRLPRAEDQEASADDPDGAAGGVLPRRGLGQRLARLQVQDRHLRQLQRGQAGPQDARQEEGRQEWRD